MWLLHRLHLYKGKDVFGGRIWTDVKFFAPLLGFLMSIGYGGPLLMGVLDSSFLVLPFGNDLLIVWMIAQRRHGAAWLVLAAAAGSTIGALLLSLVARRVGESGIRKLAGGNRYRMLCNKVGKRSWLAVAFAGLAPPPFPYSLVIAVAAAVGSRLWAILTANFVARALRFAVLAFLAMRFGDGVVRVMKSDPFRWTVVVLVFLCGVASVFSIWKWVRHTRGGKKKRRRKTGGGQGVKASASMKA